MKRASADSVFQIACHGEMFGLKHLLDICERVRDLADEYSIGRIIESEISVFIWWSTYMEKYKFCLVTKEKSFVDLGQTISEYFSLSELDYRTSFLNKIIKANE